MALAPGEIVDRDGIAPLADAIEKLLQLFLLELPVAGAVQSAEDAIEDAGLLHPGILVRPVKIAGRNASIAVAIQPLPQRFVALELVARDVGRLRIDSLLLDQPFPGVSILGRAKQPLSPPIIEPRRIAVSMRTPSGCLSEYCLSSSSAVA